MPKTIEAHFDAINFNIIHYTQRMNQVIWSNQMPQHRHSVIFFFQYPARVKHKSCKLKAKHISTFIEKCNLYILMIWEFKWNCDNGGFMFYIHSLQVEKWNHIWSLYQLLCSTFFKKIKKKKKTHKIFHIFFITSLLKTREIKHKKLFDCISLLLFVVLFLSFVKGWML